MIVYPKTTSPIHRRSQYEANRGTRLGKILPNTVDFYFFIRLIILEDFIRLISYNGPCVRLGCSFFLATALIRHEGLKCFSDTEQNSSRVRVPEQNFEQNKRFLRAEFIQA